LPTGLPRFRRGDRPLAADWELVELLGKGGFGEVWLARHLHRSNQKPVALKFCLDPVAAESLRNEVVLHNLLDRVRNQGAASGIVPLLETYLTANPPCLMYEYVEGGDLTGLFPEARLGGLAPDLATRIVQRLASIVASAHRLNPPLVHRDLKPSNILVR
jgi:serine/threonine protein kinase